MLSNDEYFEMLKSIIGTKLTHLKSDSEADREAKTFEFLFLSNEIRKCSQKKFSIPKLRTLWQAEFNKKEIPALDAIVKVFGFGDWKTFKEKVPLYTSPEYLSQCSLLSFSYWEEYWLNPNKLVPIGRLLARKVAERLKAGHVLAAVHTGYCGTGFLYSRGCYLYGHFSDQLEIIQKFEQDELFIEWLSCQTDKSLSGEEEDLFFQYNQRVTTARLKEFCSPPKS